MHFKRISAQERIQIF